MHICLKVYLYVQNKLSKNSVTQVIFMAMCRRIHQGESDWGTVGRPIAYGVCGNSIIHLVDLATAKMDIDSE